MTRQRYDIFAEAIAALAADCGDPRLGVIARRAIAPLSVCVRGRAGVGRGSVERALTAAGLSGIVPAGSPVDIDLHVVAEVVKPEDCAAVAASTAPSIVVLNKSDLSGFGAAVVRCARVREMTGVPVVPMAAHLAVITVDDALLAALRTLAGRDAGVNPADGTAADLHCVRDDDVHARLLRSLGPVGVARALDTLRADPAAGAATLRGALRAHSGVEGVVGAVHSAAAPVVYRRLCEAAVELEAFAATAPSAVAERVHSLLTCDDTVIARMESALDVAKGAGLVGDTADPLCRAAQWRRLSRRADHPVYRLCGPDIVRGSLRLWRHSAEGVR